MKRMNLLSLMAFVAFIFTSCANDDLEQISASKQEVLSFGIRGIDNRGLEMTDSEMRSTGFGVFGFYTEQTEWTKSDIIPNYMYNQLVETNKMGWKYSPVKYWPSREGDKLTFFAYAPYEKSPVDGKEKGIALTGNDKTGAPLVTFTTKDAPSDMVDFVTAVIYDKTRTFSPGKTSSIDFEFIHELSRFSFIAKNQTTDSFINIKNAKLSFGEDCNIYKSALYSFPEKNETNGTWHYENGVKFKHDYELRGILNVSENNRIGEGKDCYNVNGILIPYGQQADLFNGKYMFFIPANGSEGSKIDAVSVTFEYDIVTPDTSVKNGYTSSSQVKTLSLPAGKFKQGVSYTLVFNLDGDFIELESNIISRSY